MASADNDIKASAIFTVTGQPTAADGSPLPTNIRVVGMYYSASATGTITLSEGNGGTVRIPITTASGASGMVNVPQNGIWFRTAAPYATVTGTLTGCTLFYVG